MGVWQELWAIIKRFACFLKDPQKKMSENVKEPNCSWLGLQLLLLNREIMANTWKQCTYMYAVLNRQYKV